MGAFALWTILIPFLAAFLFLQWTASLRNRLRAQITLPFPRTLFWGSLPLKTQTHLQKPTFRSQKISWTGRFPFIWLLLNFLYSVIVLISKSSWISEHSLFIAFWGCFWSFERQYLLFSLWEYWIYEVFSAVYICKTSQILFLMALHIQACLFYPVTIPKLITEYFLLVCASCSWTIPASRTYALLLYIS